MTIYKEKNCKLCNNIFNPTSPKQKYCLSCKDLATKEAQAERDKKRNRLKHNIEYEKKCLACGVTFTTYYKSKKYCGAEECEQFRRSLKNSIGHTNRDKIALLEKGRKYYINNTEKCRLSAATYYRKNNPEAKEYIPRVKFRNSFEEVNSYIESKGYKLLSKEYINNRANIELQCPEGHIYETTYHNFRDNGGLQGNRCPICYQQNNYVSKPEQLVRGFVSENFPDISVEYNNRTIIAPKELDLYFPDNNLAIEVCGLYWHGELSSGKTRNYHYNKMEACYKAGVRLITIFEDELINNKDIVLSRIRQALGRPIQRIYARKCIVKEIDSKTANKFFTENHIQGKSTALVRYGLYYEDKLMCVGSLGKIIRKHTSKNSTLELKRLCTLKDVSVVGGASKIFKQLLRYAKENKYTEIKSYCDMKYANIFNPIYEVLGFELTNFTKYTPHYVKDSKRYRNISLRKTPEERLLGKTEWELRKEQGYDRIWDCGHRTYIYKIN